MPRKNVYPLLGRPLIAHVGALVKELPFVDRAIVSTDDAEIAEVGRSAGLEVPFQRPKELSGDWISDEQVLYHALTEFEGMQRTRYDLIVMLQPTSPLRTAAHVEAAMHKLVDEGWDAVWAVSKTDPKYHPLKQLILDEQGRLAYYDPQGATIVARQQLGQVYHRNGSVYVFTRDCVLARQTRTSQRMGAIVIDPPMISVDTLEDVAIAEQRLAARQRRQEAGSPSCGT